MCICAAFSAIFCRRSISAPSELGIPSRSVRNENDEIRYRLRLHHASWGETRFLAVSMSALFLIETKYLEERNGNFQYRTPPNISRCVILQSYATIIVPDIVVGRIIYAVFLRTNIFTRHSVFTRERSESGKRKNNNRIGGKKIVRTDMQRPSAERKNEREVVL